MPRSAWEITHIEELPSGRRYTAQLGGVEWVVLHVPGGWQFWNGYSRCEANGGLRAAILDYEHDDPIQSEPARRDVNTRDRARYKYDNVDHEEGSYTESARELDNFDGYGLETR